MAKYSVKIPNRIVYSIGDTHGRGREVLEFISKLEMRSLLNGEDLPAFVQLGDLCDGFSFQVDTSNEALRAASKKRIDEMPELQNVLFHDGNLFIDWRKEEGERARLTGQELLDSEDRDVIIATYQAFKCFETLMLYSRYQRLHSQSFYVVFGNHDADLLRGRCAYGRQQKYILFGLLGLSPDAVLAHMTDGKTRRVLRNPWLNWLYHRPHIALSDDTVYMHGGPTGTLTEQLRANGENAFESWLNEADIARGRGLSDPMFTEHNSFLSPDGAPNDWLKHPACILDFLKSAGKKYLAVGHSPFLDYEKGPILDLPNATEAMKYRFKTPAILPPEGRLIKHDTDMKRIGDLWACRHDSVSDTWIGIDANLNNSALRTE